MRTHPNPTLKASQNTENPLEPDGKANIGAVVKHVLSF